MQIQNISNYNQKNNSYSKLKFGTRLILPKSDFKTLMSSTDKMIKDSASSNSKVFSSVKKGAYQLISNIFEAVEKFNASPKFHKKLQKPLALNIKPTNAKGNKIGFDINIKDSKTPIETKFSPNDVKKEQNFFNNAIENLHQEFSEHSELESKISQLAQKISK